MEDGVATLDSKQIAREKRVDGAHTPGAWLAGLRPVAEDDRQGDIIRRLFLGVAIPSFLAAVIGGVITQSLLVAMVFAALGVVFLAAFFVMRRRDLPDNLRRFVIPLLAVLREEMKPDEPLTMRLDLGGGTLIEKQTSQRKLGVGYPSIKETHYTDAWLSGAARLADDARLAWQITDYIRKREITKRTARGKIKTKAKYKVKTVVEVRLGLPREDYTPHVEAALTDEGDRLALKPGAKRDVIRVRRVVVANQLDTRLDPRHVLDLVAGAYKQVALTGAGERTP
jgi:hypothetical protein